MTSAGPKRRDSLPKHRKPAMDGTMPDASGADVFFEAFTLARMRGELVGETIFRGREHCVFTQDHAVFHFVDASPCEFLSRQAGNFVARTGDLVMFPRGCRHRVRRAIGSGRERENEFAKLTTGAMHFEAAGGSLLMQALPEVIHVASARAAGNGAPGESAKWLAITFDAMRKESSTPSIGSKVMLSRLVDMVFIWAVRHWLANSPPGERGWVSGLRDPLVAQALSLLHGNPRHDWSVEELAARLHQSRSSFSQRFVSLVGEPPMRYLARWRMTLAANLLHESTLQVARIAEQVGYVSEAAFGRSFKRQMGVAPKEYRARREERG